MFTFKGFDTYLERSLNVMFINKQMQFINFKPETEQDHYMYFFFEISQHYGPLRGLTVYRT